MLRERLRRHDHDRPAVVAGADWPRCRGRIQVLERQRPGRASGSQAIDDGVATTLPDAAWGTLIPPTWPSVIDVGVRVEAALVRLRGPRSAR